MELYIETLTGTAFELRVSPFETVMSVKAKIQRLEVPMEDPALREMAEYVEANQNEILKKLPGNRQVTLLVFREGDQLNFFRVVDHGDGTLTPLSESFSGASMYNFNDGDDEEDAASKEKVEENEQLKEKMKQIRSKMDKLNISKKPHRKHHPPATGRTSSRTSRLHHLPANTCYSLGPSLNRNLCLPPVGTGYHVGGISHSLALQQPLFEERIEQLDPEGDKDGSATSFDSALQAIIDSSGEDTPVDTDNSFEGANFDELSNSASKNFDSMDRFSQVLSRVIEGEACKLREENVVNNWEKNMKLESKKDLSDNSLDDAVTIGETDLREKPLIDVTVCDAGTSSDTSLKQDLLDLNSPDIDTSLTSHTVTSKAKDITIDKLRESLHPHNSLMGKKSTKVKSQYSLYDSLRETISASKSLSKNSSLDKRKEFTLESLSTIEAKAMSGLLRQASLEKVGSSSIGNVTVTSASRNRVTGNCTLGNSTFPNSRIMTPEGRLMSACVQRITAASHDGHILSPTHRLPPVRSKKKVSKRCSVCSKKTGLACSYTCRCGHNFCAGHRYAESHDCTFDYKTEGRKILEQNNPVVNAPKLPKI